MKRGGWFETEISEALKLCKMCYKDNFFYRRILDSGRVGIKVPADFFVIHDGHPCLIECKSTSIKSSFPMANVTPHQIDDLSEANRAGATSLILIKKNKYPAKCYCISIQGYNDICMNLRIQGRKSIRWDSLDSYPQAVPLGKIGTTWDLRPIFTPQNQDQRAP